MEREYEVKGLPLIRVSYADLLKRPLYYPENQFTEEMVKLMRRKSLTIKELENMKRIGFKIEMCAKKQKEHVLPDIFKDDK